MKKIHRETEREREREREREAGILNAHLQASDLR